MVDRYDPDELLVCPYDPVHRVARKRFQGHLIKCRKVEKEEINYDTRDYSVCPFNAKHVVPKPELAYHVDTCEDRGRMEHEIHHSTATYKAKGNTIIPVNNWRPPSPEESWDDDNVKYIPKDSGDLFDEEDELPEPLPQSRTVPIAKTQSHSNPVVRLPNTTDSKTPVYNFSLATGGRGRGRGLSQVSLPSSAVGRGKGILGMGQPREPVPPMGLSRGGVVNKLPPQSPPRPLGGVVRNLPPQSPPKQLGNGVISVPPQSPPKSSNGQPLDTIPLNNMDDKPSDSDNSDDKRTTLKKRIRKLNKMVKQIEQIEMKLEAGGELQEDQRKKLLRKEDALKRLSEAQQELFDLES